MPTLKINAKDRPLVRITYDKDRVSFESNLSDGNSADAIIRAIENLGRAVGQLDRARAEANTLRTTKAPAMRAAKVFARMHTEVFAAMGSPDFDSDLGDWTPSAADGRELDDPKASSFS